VWPFGFVVHAPGFDGLLRITEADEPGLVQAFVAERPIEALDERVLHGLAGIDEVEHHIVRVS